MRTEEFESQDYFKGKEIGYKKGQWDVLWLLPEKQRKKILKQLNKE